MDEHSNVEISIFHGQKCVLISTSCKKKFVLNIMNFNMEEHLKVERSVVYGQKCVQISTSYKIFRNKT